MNDINSLKESLSNCKKVFSKQCVCERTFNVKSTYYKHRKTCIAAINNTDIYSGNYLCQERNCVFRCKVSKLFQEHLKCAHNIETPTEVKYFEKYCDFIAWKECFEKETKACFLLQKTKNRGLPLRREYYYCNRSGSYTTQSKGKRIMKYQGLRKIGFNCPASVIVNINEMEDDIRATVHPLHYGHDNELCHIPLPKSDRAYIAGQLLQGVEKSQILNNICSERKDVEERKHLCTRRDLSNISRSFGIDSSKKRRLCEEREEHLDVVYEITVTTSADENATSELKSELQNDNLDNVGNEIEINYSQEEYFLEYVKSDIETTEKNSCDNYVKLTENSGDSDSENLLLAADRHIKSAYDLLSLSAHPSNYVDVANESAETSEQNEIEIFLFKPQ